MLFFWFLIGAIVGAALAWYFLNQNCAKELADKDRLISKLNDRLAEKKALAATTPQPKPANGNSQPKSAGPKAKPSGSVDDLTRIKGIGKVIAGKLNELGIRSFEQIASFTQSDIDRINAQLNFKGRIERENWIEQARELSRSS